MHASLQALFPGMPAATLAHLAEIAEESGIDLDEESAISHERDIEIPGCPHRIETFYQESATWKPWQAFIMGIGTRSGWSAEEAAAEVAALAARPQ